MAAYHAKKRLGQHFLKSPAVIQKIVALIDQGSEVPVIEIGPGRGALTLPLAERGIRILAVEFDRDIVGYLRKLLRKHDNVEVINQDFLSFEPDVKELPVFSLMGNLPYNITSPVIDWCVRHHDYLRQAVFMVQKEMAERIVAEPKSKGWSPLSVLTQLYFSVRHCFDVSPDSFRPQPQVISSVIELRPIEQSSGVDIRLLEKVVRAAFSQRRKLLINNLVPDPISSKELAVAICTELSLPDSCRAEELSIEQFLKLTDALAGRNML